VNILGGLLKEQVIAPLTKIVRVKGLEPPCC
jgi:hypothetical protein